MTDHDPADQKAVTWARQQLRIRSIRVTRLLLHELAATTVPGPAQPSRPEAEWEAER